MKILLTGTSGQVGHALRHALQGLGDVIIPAREQMDLGNPHALRQTIREIGPDLIINPAAYTAVDKAESEPELAHRINAIAPGIMAEEAKKLGAALIHYSTDYVFDGTKRDVTGNLLAYEEQDMPFPINVYGKTKLAGEQAIRDSDCRHLIFRTSWVYSTFGKNFLLTMLRLAKERDELKVVNDQWGAPSSAEWIAKCTANIIGQLQSSTSGQDWWEKNSGLYNMTPAGLTSWCGFTQEIVRLAKALALFDKPTPKVTGISAKEYPVQAARPVNSLLSTNLLFYRFGIQAPVWQEPVLDCLRAISTNQQSENHTN